MRLRLECREGLDDDSKRQLAEKVAQEVKRQIMVSCDVDACTYGSLPRSERKSKRVFDNRQG